MSIEILDLQMDANDAKATTVRAYFKALLVALIEEGEGFSGKRPFGNSGWIYDLAQPIVKAGIMAGDLDEDGYIVKIDRKKLQDELILAVNRL